MGMTGVMQPIRTLARPLMAAPFVVTGIETLRDPGSRAEKIAPVIKPLADRVSWLPTKDPESLVRLQGALALGTGALLALGRFQRLSTLVLAGQLVPSLLAEHRFWAEDDPERRAAERSQFFKTAGLFGALLVAATAPSKYRPMKAARAGAHEAKLQAALARSEASRKAERARRKAAKRMASTRKKAAKVGH
nr:DoxX family protein [Actinoallomurus spadix]